MTASISKNCCYEGEKKSDKSKQLFKGKIMIAEILNKC